MRAQRLCVRLESRVTSHESRVMSHDSRVMTLPLCVQVQHSTHVAAHPIRQANAADPHRHSGLCCSSAAAATRAGAWQQGDHDVPLLHAHWLNWHNSRPQSAATHNPASRLRKHRAGGPEAHWQQPALHPRRVRQVLIVNADACVACRMSQIHVTCHQLVSHVTLAASGAPS